MKKVYFSLLCLAAIAFCSCSHSVYPLDTMYGQYNNRMRSSAELALKSNIWIYFTENEIPCEYDIISANTYHPITLLPFNSIRVKKMNKRFLEQAVKQADKEGGNAVLIQGGGFYFVLNMKNREGVEAPTANFVNPILDMKTAEVVKSKAMASMKHGERSRTIKAFKDEIKSNIDYLQTPEEIAAVRKKLDVLSRYNLQAKHPQKAIDKFVRKQTRKVNRAEKKMAKLAAKQKAAVSAKKSAAKSKKK